MGLIVYIVISTFLFVTIIYSVVLMRKIGKDMGDQWKRILDLNDRLDYHEQNCEHIKRKT